MALSKLKIFLLYYFLLFIDFSALLVIDSFFKNYPFKLSEMIPEEHKRNAIDQDMSRFPKLVLGLFWWLNGMTWVDFRYLNFFWMMKMAKIAWITQVEIRIISKIGTSNESSSLKNSPTQIFWGKNVRLLGKYVKRALVVNVSGWIIITFYSLVLAKGSMKVVGNWNSKPKPPVTTLVLILLAKR